MRTLARAVLATPECQILRAADHLNPVPRSRFFCAVDPIWKGASNNWKTVKGVWKVFPNSSLYLQTYIRRESKEVQRTTRPTYNPSNRPTSAQTNRTASGQSRAASPQVNRDTVSQAGRAGSQSGSTGNVKVVVCRKCKSPQIVANKRGYSFAKMFKTLGWMALLPLLFLVVTVAGSYMVWTNVKLGSGGGSSVNGGFFESLTTIIGILCWISFTLSLPVSILVGFVGRSEIVNGCMNCGFKWKPAKRK